MFIKAIKVIVFGLVPAMIMLAVYVGIAAIYLNLSA